MKKIVVIGLLWSCAMVYSQENKKNQDSIKTTQLKEVIVSGDIKKDPSQILIHDPDRNEGSGPDCGVRVRVCFL